MLDSKIVMYAALALLVWFVVFKKEKYEEDYDEEDYDEEDYEEDYDSDSDSDSDE